MATKTNQRKSPEKAQRMDRPPGSPKRDAFEVSVNSMKSFKTKDNKQFDNEPESSPLPNINNRLGQLRPSRELLEYYRKKITEYDEEHEDMVSKLEEYKVTYEEQHKLQWELRQREEEIVELQKALSDMQVYLFQEREHVLRLYSENDRLKIRELEDKKKIQQLLALSGTPDCEITYFMKEPPAKAVVEQKVPKKLHGVRDLDTKNSKGQKKKVSLGSEKKRSHSPGAEEKIKHDNQVLVLQVESLQAQLEEQAKLSKEQAEALIEDRRVKEDEAETRRQRDEEKIRILTEKLHKTQDLLYESTKDYLELRFQGRDNERQWMASKDRLLRELDTCKEQLNMSKESVLNVSHGYDSKGHLEEDIKSLEYQLQQAQKLAENYREQLIQLEDNYSRIKEEGDVTREIFQDRSEKLAKRLSLMNTRYQDLEKRRNLEVEGFKNDIKNLRKRLKDVERQLYKVTIGFADDIDMKRPDDIDLHILRNVRNTATRSKKMFGELKNLKSKIYGLENDLKHT